MRNAMPLRWIEQAEARRVMATAVFDYMPRQSFRRYAAAWLPRLRAWLLPDRAMDWGAMQAQPALVPVQRCGRRSDENGYGCDW